MPKHTEEEYEEDTLMEASWSAIALALALILSFVTGLAIGMIVKMEGITKR